MAENAENDALAGNNVAQNGAQANENVASPPAEGQNTSPTPVVDSSGRVHDPESGRFVPASRFDAEVGKKWEAIRKAERLEEQLKQMEERLGAPNAPAQPSYGQPGMPQAAYSPPSAPSEAEIQRRAAQLAAEQRFNERCVESVNEGKKAHGDFLDAIESLKRVSPHSMSGPNGVPVPVLPPVFIEAALDTGKGHEVLYALGKDPAEADRIMSLSPTKQAIELARLADRIGGGNALANAPTAAPAALDPAAIRSAISSAPPPVRDVVGSRSVTPGGFDPYDTQTQSTDAWIRQREAEVRERKSKGRGW